MMIDLSPYGWKGCSIREDLRNLRASLPTWDRLHLLRKSPLSSSLLLPYIPFRDSSGAAFMPAYRKGVLYNRGAYSTLYKGGRVVYDCVPSATKGYADLLLRDGLTECAIKEIGLHVTPAEEAGTPRTKHVAYEDEINAILYEAVIHLLVCRTLAAVGHPTFAPRFYEVVANGDMPLDTPTRVRSLWCCMEFLEGTPLDVACRAELVPLKSAATPEALAALRQKNEAFLLDVTIQIAFILHVLQRDLRFHHRDLKLNNVFRRSTPSTQVLTLPSSQGPTTKTWTCVNDLVLLDYGFSCIACGTEQGAVSPRATLLGAGSWFTDDDDCCKEGRDLAQFIFSLHCHFPLSEYVGAELFEFFRKALTATSAKGDVSMMSGFTTDGVPSAPGTKAAYHKGVYCFLKRADVEVPALVPATFLAAAAAAAETAVPANAGAPKN